MSFNEFPFFQNYKSDWYQLGFFCEEIYIQHEADNDDISIGAIHGYNEREEPSGISLIYLNLFFITKSLNRNFEHIQNGLFTGGVGLFIDGLLMFGSMSGCMLLVSVMNI